MWKLFSSPALAETVFFVLAVLHKVFYTGMKSIDQVGVAYEMCMRKRLQRTSQFGPSRTLFPMIYYQIGGFSQ